MTRPERYFIGPGVRHKLESLLDRASSVPISGGGGAGIPTVMQSVPSGGGPSVRLGRTETAWNKDDLATITLYEEGTPPYETAKSPTPETLPDCVNKFANVGAGAWVMVARGANGYWYLIAAECS